MQDSLLETNVNGPQIETPVKRLRRVSTKSDFSTRGGLYSSKWTDIPHSDTAVLLVATHNGRIRQTSLGDVTIDFKEPRRNILARSIPSAVKYKNRQSIVAPPVRSTCYSLPKTYDADPDSTLRVSFVVNHRPEVVKAIRA
jgi:hypothetical protein